MKRQTSFSLSLGAAILVGGFVGMFVLFQFREPPVEASTGSEERMLDVRVAKAVPINHTVIVEGFGAARPRTSVTVRPEVSGRVVYASPSVRVGEHVQVGELLLELDPEHYTSVVTEREAQIGQLRAELERLVISRSNDGARSSALQRSRDLARAQFERAKTLLEESVGNQLDVDRSEQAYNEADDRLRQLQNLLNTYPMAIEEAEKGLTAAEATLARAKLDLDRTKILAPFSGRIDSILVAPPNGTESAAVAVGHFAEAGGPLFVLADDTSFEIPIKLDMRDAHDWLRVAREGDGSFELEPVECEVAWTEVTDGAVWSGTLDRIEHYDAPSRTVTAVVTVDIPRQTASTYALAQGMFCNVRVPGKTLEGVFEVEQAAISVDGAVRLAVDGRLESRPVHVARTEGAIAIVDEGLREGDLVITTRLVNPIEQSLLRIADAAPASAE